MRKKHPLSVLTKYFFAVLLLFLPLLSGCGKTPAPAEFHPEEGYLRVSSPISFDIGTLSAVPDNPNPTLSVPTYITKIKENYFIVDCYHNQVIYHDNLEDPLYTWRIMTGDVSRPHTVAGDGQVYLVDDTENNRILVLEEGVNENGVFIFIPTQEFTEIGVRPHYIVYDEASQTFYVWSSESGEMYLFRRPSGSTTLYLTEIRSIPSLDHIYVRSFTILDDDIYFVSGNSSIIVADKETFRIKKEYPVPDALAGMVQLTKIQDYFYITISTDVNGDQNYATLLRTRSLKDLEKGNYEDIYASFIGGGTPYYISEIEGTYYLTEHRLPGHSIWSFQVKDNVLTDIRTLY